jgi:alkylation response protein AidB-like acyl-CoA dehydrogenase
VTADLAALTATDQRALLTMVDDFARRTVAPLVRDYDAAEQLPPGLLAQMAELGLFGGIVPVELGGAGLDYLTFSRVIERISRVDHCLGVLISMPSALVGGAVLAYGTPEQKERWLRPLAEGKIFGGAGVTEPRSGSDVAGTETRYRREGDGFVLNGAKSWITNLDLASFFVTFATRDKSLGRDGLSAFLVPAETPGVGGAPVKKKNGVTPRCRAAPVQEQARVPPAVLGGAGPERGAPRSRGPARCGRRGVRRRHARG